MEEKKGSFKNFTNFYEVRKTVRFELKPQFLNPSKVKKINDKTSLEKLVKKHKDFIDLLSNTLFYKDVERGEKKEQNVFGKFFTENNLSIEKLENSELNFVEYEIYKTVYFKYQGIQKLFKDEWDIFKKEITLQQKDGNFVLDEKGKYKKKNKNYMTLGDLGSNNFLRSYFEKLLTENYYSNKILDDLNRQENIKARKSDITFEIQKLNSNDLLGNLFFLFEGGYLEHKNDVVIIEELKIYLGEIKTIIDNLLLDLKPSQSFGLMIDHISLNYYTRKKTEKLYNEEIEKIQKKLEEPYYSILGETYEINKSQGIEQLYKEMKTFKAHQKSAFLQLLQNNIKYENIKNPFTFKDNKETTHENFEVKLFNNISKENYEKMSIITNKIEIEINKKQRTLLKEQRGKHFISKYSCKNYIDFCDEYKKVSMEYGERKAKKMSLERKKIEFKKERGWGIISTDGKNHFLNTFSVENTNKAYEDFNKEKNRNENEIRYFIFSSITLRALEKLCFKKDSIFLRDIFINLSTKYKKTIEQGLKNIQVLKFKSELEEENDYITFLNEILEKQTTLGIIFSDGEKSKNILKNSQTIDEFEINLKKETYILDTFFLEKKVFDEKVKNLAGKVYEITSWDLREKRKKTEFYTKTWFNFWDKENIKNKFPIRINPEINIGYVEKNEDWKNEEQNQNQTNNRRNRERFLMFSTFSYNADAKYINDSFINDVERIKSIEKFNLNYDNNKNTYLYGIDKGVLELATLGIYEKENDTIKSVILDKIDIYKITEKGLLETKEVINKNGETKIHYLKNNPSIFFNKIEDSAIFEKQTVISCLGDLSCAKLINGKIILNADINTYNKLQEINIKRLLYKGITEGKCKSSKINYNKEEDIFSYTFENRGKDEEKKFNYGININPGNFEVKLNEYIKEVEENISSEDISIQKINNLKNAICANMVGIIMELQKYYPGFIVWENISNAWVDEQENKGNIVVGNLINEKLYNKLELLNEVPPILKKFRSEIKEDTQHGKIIYINKDYTSRNCPKCEKKLFGHLTSFENKMHHCFDICNHKDEDLKWKKKYYENSNCDFYIGNSNYLEFDFIKSGDDLATYNIAKRGLEFIMNETQNLI